MAPTWMQWKLGALSVRLSSVMDLLDMEEGEYCSVGGQRDIGIVFSTVPMNKGKQHWMQ